MEAKHYELIATQPHCTLTYLLSKTDSSQSLMSELCLLLSQQRIDFFDYEGELVFFACDDCVPTQLFDIDLDGEALARPEYLIEGYFRANPDPFKRRLLLASMNDWRLRNGYPAVTHP